MGRARGKAQRTPPSRRLTIVVRLRRVSSPSVTVGQPLSPELPGGRTREDRLDSRLRLTWLAAIRNGGGLAGRSSTNVRAAEGAGLNYPAPSRTRDYQPGPRRIGTVALD